MKDSSAAKDLLYRRARALADYENANKALEKARLKNKEVAQVKDFFLNVTKSLRKLKSELRSKNWGYKQLNDFITCIVPEYQGISCKNTVSQYYVYPDRSMNFCRNCDKQQNNNYIYKQI